MTGDKEKKKIYDKQYRKDNRKKRAKYNEQWQKNNPEKHMKSTQKWEKINPRYYKKYKREYHLIKEYGLSHENWLKMWENQGGKCAICGKEFGKPFNALVDHDHKTGKTRGLLCRKCNSALGFFEDNPDIMKSAINYINIWGKF